MTIASTGQRLLCDGQWTCHFTGVIYIPYKDPVEEV